MDRSSQIEEHMKVVGSDGEEVGTVDRIDGRHLKLTKNDKNAGGQHHYLSLDKVQAVNGRTVELSCTAQDAIRQWKTESQSGAQQQQQESR